MFLQSACTASSQKKQKTGAGFDGTFESANLSVAAAHKHFSHSHGTRQKNIQKTCVVLCFVCANLVRTCTPTREIDDHTND
jgi:hypothetical protein